MTTALTVVLWLAAANLSASLFALGYALFQSWKDRC